MKTKISNSNNGFTLVETIVAISIFSMISIVALSCMIATITSYGSGSGKIGAVSSATIAMQKLCNEIRVGKSAALSSGTLFIVYPTKSTDSTTGEIIYNLSASDPNPKRYFVYGNMLKRQYGTTTTTIAKNISEATFGASGGIVTITLKSTYQVGNKTSSHILSERIILRNYRAN